MRTLALICIILCVTSESIAQTKKVVCSWTPESALSNYQERFFIDYLNLPVTYCTHFIYPGIRNYVDGSLMSDPMSGTPYEYFRKFSEFGTLNPNIKLFVGLGGFDQGRDVFHNLSRLATARNNYINNVKTLVQTYSLDGIDFDWQYPGIQDEWIDEDRNAHVEYLRLFREALPSPYEISVSVASKPEDINRSYNVSGIIAHVDFINLKTYNLRGASASDVSETAFHSPLRSGLTQSYPENEWNVESIVSNWVSEAGGADLTGKLIIAVSTFGRSFTLQDTAINGIGAAASGIGRGGKVLPIYTDFRGILSYREICRGILNEGWTEEWSEDQVAPYALFDDQWVGYDNLKSAVNKIVFARDNDFVGGVNYVRLELEDFSNSCNNDPEGAYPLLFWGYEVLVNGGTPPDFVVPPETTLPTTTTETTLPGESPTTTTTSESITTPSDPTTISTDEPSDPTTIPTDETSEPSTPSTVSTDSTPTSEQPTDDSTISTQPTPSITPTLFPTEETSPTETVITSDQESSSRPTPPITPDLYPTTPGDITTTSSTSSSDSTISSSPTDEPESTISSDPTTEWTISSDPTDLTDSTISSDPTDEPTTPTNEPSDPTDLTDSTIPSNPTDEPTTPTNPSESTIPSDPTDQPTESTISSGPTDEPTTPTSPSESTISSGPTDESTVPSDSTISSDPTDEPTESTVSSDPTEETTSLPDDITPPGPTSRPPIDHLCLPNKTGQIAHPYDCTMFISCVHGVAYEMTCINSVNNITLYYNATSNECVYDSSVCSEIATTLATDDTSEPADNFTPPEGPEVDFICPPDVARNFAHPTDCTKFITCVWGFLFVRDCINPNTSVILYYNETVDACLWPFETECQASATTTTVITTQSTTQSTTLSEVTTSSDAETTPPDFITPPFPTIPPINFVCPPDVARNFAHPNDCTRFIACVWGYMYVMDCINPDTHVILYYNETVDACLWPHETECHLDDQSTTSQGSTESTVSSDITTSLSDETTSLSDATTTSDDETTPPDLITPPGSDPTDSPIDFVCPPNVARNFRHPHNCTLFISCVWGYMYVRECINPNTSVILYYDEPRDMCVWPHETICVIDGTTSTVAPPQVTEETTTIRPTQGPPANPPPVDFTCTTNGNFAHPTDCTLFIACSNGIPYVMTCINADNQIILYFDESRNRCVWPWQSTCVMPMP